MASLLDISLLNTYFSNIFVILFVFAASYAILMFKHPFGENKGINALLAATIALIFIFSQDAIEVIKSTVPWYIVMLVMLMFVLLVNSAFGASIPPSTMSNIGTWVLIIALFILITNVASRLGQTAGPYLGGDVTDPDNVIAGGSGDTGTNDFSQNFGATLFHPKVLAMMLVIIVATFAVLWIGYVG